MKWSGSKLGLLRLCGWAFAADHIRNVKRPPHPALAGGSATHAGLARLVQAVIDDAPIDVRAITRAVCPGGPAEYADTLAVLTLVQEELAEDPPPFEGSKVIHVEERLSVDIGPHVFEGTPDLVQAIGQRTCVIDDWKTHWRPLSQDVFEADDQLPRYALLVDAAHPDRFDTFILRMHFVRYRGAVREMTLERTHLAQVKWDLASEIEEAEARIVPRRTVLLIGSTMPTAKEMALAAASGDFTEEPAELIATPGDWCTICSRTDSCPVVQELEANGAAMSIEDDDEAAHVAGVMRAIDAHSAKLKRQLKTYLGGDHPTGRVKLAGGTYGFGPAHHTRADVRDVLEVWEEYEAPLNPFVLRVDVDQLKRSMDRAPGTMRTALKATIDEYDVADCRYRRGDNQEEEEATP
ncbi:MAG: PD-(D/E)XK nuclease family protein [Actinomycetota bacterium]|nr:PD-(D/E)XK nuclease family protein [Actinomycetota bacterium]